MTNPYANARSVAQLTILSLLSPIAGMIVELAVARRFGTSAPVDGFRIAVAVIHIGQQLFLGIFPCIIVPLFVEHQSNGNEAAAWQSSIELARLVLIPTATLSLILFALPGAAVWVLAPGVEPQTREWACSFLRWFSLSLVPLLYSGVAIGLLYAQHVFWTAAVAQSVYNLTLFTSILLFGGALLGPASITLGVLLATTAFMVLQLLRLIPLIPAAQASQCRPQRGVVRDGVRKGMHLGLPLVGLSLMNQGTAILAVWSLSGASVGTIAAMGYAGKLMQMVLLLPDVTGTVMFPRFALIARATDRKELREVATRAMRMALFIGLPIGCILFALRVSLVELLFCHGAFSTGAAHRVGLLFGLSLMGMPARILFFYQMRVFYALEDTWWPACVTFLSTLLALIIMPTAAKKFSAEGIAATFALLSWIGAIIQGYVLHVKYEAWHSRPLLVLAVRISIPAAGAAWFGVTAGQWIEAFLGNVTLALIFQFSSGAILATLVYWLLSVVTRIPEALEIKRYVRWQSIPALNEAKAVICD
jgi:putative peptidoglycan lipid II flippase